MNRLTWLVGAIVLLVSPGLVLAQRRGGHGAGTARPAAGVPNSSEVNDFDRAVALQATPDQVTEFQRLTNSTQATRNSAQQLLQVAKTASQLDLLHYSDSLKDGLDQTEINHEHFLRSFSAAQKSGLKEFMKKLQKANSDVTKQSKVLTEELARSKVNDQRIAGVAEKLDKALGDLQMRQSALGSEMGIQAEGSSQ